MAVSEDKVSFNKQAFELLKKVIKKYEPGMKLLVEQPGIYYLAYQPEEDQPEDNLFAALVAMKQGICLYLRALKVFPGFKEFIPVQILQHLDADGLRFIFKGSVDHLLDEMEMVVRLAIGIT